MELDITQNIKEFRFETQVDGELAYVKYIETKTQKLAITSTQVPEEIAGRGIAGALTQHVLEYARANKLRVDPICPYTKHYIDKHEEYQDLLLDKK